MTRLRGSCWLAAGCGGLLRAPREARGTLSDAEARAPCHMFFTQRVLEVCPARAARRPGDARGAAIFATRRVGRGAPAMRSRSGRPGTRVGPRAGRGRQRLQPGRWRTWLGRKARSPKSRHDFQVEWREYKICSKLRSSAQSRVKTACETANLSPRVVSNHNLIKGRRQMRPRAVATRVAWLGRCLPRMHAAHKVPAARAKEGGRSRIGRTNVARRHGRERRPP